ncbi:HalOD1 output domain-containing protein [Halovivax sp.]|uniref:HalOD1 output domain-containing protein n=1 Tax=Halovivax sp. TaxID=1935978 RepID=UPI0025BBBEF7|nr:HalOD1 output domain-containing protein [Halovivax sp.]
MLDESAAPVEHSYDEPTPASIAVIQALTAIEETDPIDPPIVLYDHVNPEALDLLIGHESATAAVEISFTVADYRVTVRDTGEVVVEAS